MKAKCPECKNIIRINEHRVFLQHTHTIINSYGNGNVKVTTETVLCKGSFTKAIFVEP